MTWCKAGKQLMELVKDVDRFAATESLTHESINKFGLASSPEKRKFNYVVSIQEVQHGFLNVEEYRNSGGAPAEFPDGVATNGLPALVLIFHPYNAMNFEMTCEGLARWNGGLAWQVHFKQRKTSRTQSRGTGLARMDLLIQLPLKVAPGFQLTTIRSFGWKQIWSLLCRKSNWSRIIPTSNMVP